MIPILVYALAAIAVFIGVCAALGLHRDLREDLAYAGRRSRGLRIVISSTNPEAPKTCPRPAHDQGRCGGLGLARNSQLLTPTTTKGGLHGRS